MESRHFLTQGFSFPHLPVLHIGKEKVKSVLGYLLWETEIGVEIVMP